MWYVGNHTTSEGWFTHEMILQLRTCKTHVLFSSFWMSAGEVRGTFLKGVEQFTDMTKWMKKSSISLRKRSEEFWISWVPVTVISSVGWWSAEPVKW